jgi:hypothetical protein
VEFALTQSIRWPQPVIAYQVNSAGSDLTTLTTPTFTPAAAEIFVVKCVAADSSLTFGTPTGGGWTYDPRGNDGTASHVRAQMWTAQVTGTPASMSIAVTATGTVHEHSIFVERWRNTQLASSPALTDTTGSGAPSATNATTGVRSVVSWCSGDWAAVDGIARAYRSEAQETGYTLRAGAFTGYSAYQPAAVPGAQTFGLTLPAGQTWTVLAVELQTLAPVKAIPPITQYAGFF